MAESILLLTKFVGKFSQDYEATDKFNKFLNTLLDDNINIFIHSLERNSNDVKQAYNSVYHPENLRVTQQPSKPKPKPQRKSKSIYISENSPDKLAGDIIGDKFRYRNQGKLFWDGKQAIPLSDKLDENGHVPPVIETCVGDAIQDALYWQDTIVYNNLVYACFDKSLVTNIQACKDGFTFDFKDAKWLVVTDNIESIYNPGYWNNILFDDDYEYLADDLKIQYKHVLIQNK